MDVQSSTAQPNVARFSRYRSVRKAISHEDNKIAIPVVPEIPASIQENNTPANRAPSRYRRTTAPRVPNVPTPTIVPTITKVPARYQHRSPGSEQQAISESIEKEHISPLPIYANVHEINNVQTPPQISSQPQTFDTVPITQSADRRKTRHRSRTVTSPQARQSVRRSSYDAAREEARLILEGEYDRLQKLKVQQEKAEKERKMRADAKVAAQRKAQQELVAVQQEQVQEPEKPRRTRKWTIGGGSSNTPTTPPMPLSPSSSGNSQTKKAHTGRQPSPDERRMRRDVTRKGRSRKESETTNEDRSQSRRRGGRTAHSRPREPADQRGWEPKIGDGPPKTAVNGPQTTVDAPVSAVNAGERRVEIRYEKSKITLPVTPTTTVKDLLNTASVIMSQPIDPRTAVLVETYYPLGLERPLRRYEHIRDIMNAWDSDTQNYLMILPQSECAAVGLEQKDAPVIQPPLTTVNLLHSQRPGKWEKHWMILKSDGQVTASTKENDGNAANVFHLSDFDVYMPTKKEMRKLRPPKKICFAIKSQQRSIMFESTENFVHFFATNDKSVADQWYNAVQAWRSWYLVNVLEAGTGAKPVDAAAAVVAVVSGVATPRRPSTSHSRETIPYQLGTFEPLLDFSADAFAYGEEERKAELATPKSVTSPRRSKTLVDHARSKSITDTRVTGLARHTTTKRQKPSISAVPAKIEVASAVNAPPPSSTDAAFTGSGLLARAFSVRKAQAEDNAAFMENTDNAFTGKGLLSKKTSTKKFLRENPNPGVIENTSEAFTGAGLISRKVSVKKITNEDLFPGVVQNTNEAFTGGGMLGVQRALTKKRSAASARPGQPLVDLTGNSEFVDRSLLRQVEQYEMQTGANMPAIDRSRGVEVKDKVGEGL